VSCGGGPGTAAPACSSSGASLAGSVGGGPPNKVVGRDTNFPINMSQSWTSQTATGMSEPNHYSPLNNTVTTVSNNMNNGLHQYKKHHEHKEMEDSNAVVSSTQDIEQQQAPHSRYPTRILSPGIPNHNNTGEVVRTYCDEAHRGRQEHFGTFYGILNDLQDGSCPEIDQILAEESYTEIKTENPLDSLHINQQTDIGYLPHQDLYPSSYLRQNCPSSGESVSGYRYSNNCREEGVPGGGGVAGVHGGVQYPTQLHLKAGPAGPSEGKSGQGLPGQYSPLSPASPSVKHETRARDDKYWERRRKNNLAAKKSRDARRVRENQLRLRVLCSENQIRVLRSQLDRSQEENQLLRERLKKYEGDLPINSIADYSLCPGEQDYDEAVGGGHPVGGGNIDTGGVGPPGGGEADYRMAGNGSGSITRSVSKLMEDDLQHNKT